MGLTAGTKMEDIELDKIFIGSCTNSRIEDLRAAAKIVSGTEGFPNLKRAMVVPGSGNIKVQAEREGLDKIFLDAGFEWREAGCSMCLGMNPDILSPRERCASTSNRNFEGRQGGTWPHSPHVSSHGCRRFSDRQDHRRPKARRQCYSSESEPQARSSAGVRRSRLR